MKEVKHEETINVNFSNNNSEDNEEVVVPSEEELESKEEVEEEEVEETLESESSNDEEVEEETPKTPSQPKPVEGETPRERALRLETAKLRKKLRDKNQIDFGNEKKTELPKEDILSDKYSQEELSDIDNIIDRKLKSGGYVKKEDAYAEDSNSLLDDFFNSDHPEYLPDNDEDNLRWNAFSEIIKTDYNAKGKTKAQLKVIFNKVHRDVEDMYGSVDNKKRQLKINAQNKKIESASISGGGGTATQPKSNQNSLTPDQKSMIGPGGMFKGFDESDF